MTTAVESFLDWLRLERGRSPRTLASYEGDLRRWTNHLAAVGSSVGAATASDVSGYLDALTRDGRSPSTVARAFVAIRSLYRHGVAEGLLAHDPTLAVDGPRTPAGLPRALSVGQVEQLLDSIPADRPVDLRDRAMLELLYGTGMRISELCGLRLGDVDLDGRLIRVLGKGAKERVVPVGRIAAEAVAVWFDVDGRPKMAPGQWRRRDDSDAVFLNQRGGRLSRQGAWFVLDARARAVSLGGVVSPHVLRHSCATHMLEGGADIRSVQELLGHASISTTQIYTKVAVGRLWSEYDRCHPRAGRTTPVVSAR